MISGKTIRINGVLMPMMPYGCHSSIAPNKFKNDVVYHSNGILKWPATMTKFCQYDKKDTDERCNGCTHPRG